MNLTSLGKLLIFTALLLLAVGLGFYILGRGLRLNKFPGDIVYRRGRTTIYFPLVASLVVSALLTGLLNLFLYLWRR